MSDFVDTLLDRLAQLEDARRPWESHWREIARYVAPDMAYHEMLEAVDGGASRPYGAQQAPNIYDHTSLMAIDRLAAGEISLVMPTSATWHTLKSNDPFAAEPDDTEKRWFDDLTRYSFRMRYNPVSGFTLASKAAVKGRAAFGTSIMYVEESFGKGLSSPISYRHVPLLENHLATNFEGVVDTNFRVFRRNARQCVERWGDKCSEKVRQAADDPKRQEKPVTLIHAVMPHPKGDGSPMRFASYYFEKDEKHLIGEGGYRSFPYIVFHWNREHQGPYCEGPVSLALAEIKSVNMLSKQEYIATQQWVNPPTAQRDDAANPPNLNPGAPNPGLLSETGELLIRPIITQQRPDFARAVIEAKQSQLRDSLYVNLWQILIQNPQMTATEAAIRAQEKADLLGPSGLSLQEGLARMVDREFAILESKGVFRPGAALAAPASLEGTDIGVAFTGPLDRMRRAGEVIGMQRVLELAGLMAQLGKPEVLQRFDMNEMLEIAQDVHGAPRSIFRPAEDVERDTDKASQLQQILGSMDVIRAGGEAAKAAAEGGKALGATGPDGAVDPETLAAMLQGAVGAPPDQQEA
ncbi:portal protein [Hoeflea sp.]|uniref:portal protein n=1 Tax=Hoeflea sp. TaxID=1940281 RepID=UPI003B02C414